MPKAYARRKIDSRKGCQGCKIVRAGKAASRTVDRGFYFVLFFLNFIFFLLTADGGEISSVKSQNKKPAKITKINLGKTFQQQQ